MWALAKKYVAKFWWILALVGVDLYVWIRARLREAERAALLRQQLEIESRMNIRLRDSDNISRTERREYERAMEVRRESVEIKKHELEAEASADARALADLWNRSFGPKRDPSPPPAP